MSEVREEMGRGEHIDLPKSGLPFALPEVATVDPRDEERYLYHLDDSIESLDTMISDWMDMLDQASSSLKPAPCKPWMPSYLPGGDAVIKRLRSELESIAQRKGEFIDEALKLVELREVYDPNVPSRYVHLFLDMMDGTCDYGRLDFFKKKVERWEDHSRASMEELTSREWLDRYKEENSNEPVYMVHCPVTNVVFEDVMERASVLMDGYMGTRYPSFYKENGAEMAVASCMEIQVLDAEDDGSGDIRLTPVTTFEVNPYAHLLTLKEATRTFSEDDSRLN